MSSRRVERQREADKHWMPKSAHNKIWIEGAEWADRTMIEKSAAWWTHYMVDYLQADPQVIEDYKKAMEYEPDHHRH